jgi:peptidoglycan/LPS O-acetylase OafA/YrhL
MDTVNPKINSLTSLRFFAAALIVLGHSAGLFGFPKDWPHNLATYQGVTFFFVLSGFILTYVYPSIDSWAAARRFAVSRVGRIWPAHFTTGLLSIVLLPWVLPAALTGFGKLTAALNLMMVQAWVPVSASYFSFNAVSWSISVEFFFYLNFLWLIRNIDTTYKFKLPGAFVGAVVMMLLFHWLRTPVHSNSPFVVDGDALIYISPLARVFEFVLGMAAASVFKSLQRSGAAALTGTAATVVELALVAIVIAQICYCGPYWFALGPPRRLPQELAFWLERSGAAPLYALMIVVFAFERGTISRALRWSFLVLLGEISYSIYLLHQLVVMWVITHPALAAFVSNTVGYALFVAVTILASLLMWQFIERPFRALITRGPRGFLKALSLPWGQREVRLAARHLPGASAGDWRRGPP